MRYFFVKYTIFITFTFKVPQICYSWASRKTKNAKLYNFVPVPTVVETVMEAIPLLVMYLFNYGGLDLVLERCEIFLTKCFF